MHLMHNYIAKLECSRDSGLCIFTAMACRPSMMTPKKFIVRAHLYQLQQSFPMANWTYHPLCVPLLRLQSPHPHTYTATTPGHQIIRKSSSLVCTNKHKSNTPYFRTIPRLTVTLFFPTHVTVAYGENAKLGIASKLPYNRGRGR